MGTALTALAATGALLFTGVSSLQAKEELRNRGAEIAIAREEHNLAREAQVTDRFTAAVAQLGEDSMDVRLGGIYALQRIMEDSKRDRPAILSVLSAFVRTHGEHPKPKGKAPDGVKAPAPEDARTAAAVLGARKQDPNDGDSGVDWTGAYLVGADLVSADLFGSVLNDTDLSGAFLYDAALDVASLSDARLIGADLRLAKIGDARLNDADLEGAWLEGADLLATRMDGANLKNSILRGASARDVTWTKADLTGADLDDADLRGAYGLTAAQVASACPTKSTKLPRNIMTNRLVRDRMQEVSAGRACTWMAPPGTSSLL